MPRLTMRHKKRSTAKRAKNRRVSRKISVLRHESPKVPQRQAVAMALNMERRHRLGPNGEYYRVKKRKTTRRQGR